MARCKIDQFNRIDKADRLAYRVKNFQTDVLVKDKKEFERKYDGIIVDNVSIDEIMLLLVKGEE
ncbi:hypothetical protein D3C78_1924820 [compost metagenome]